VEFVWELDLKRLRVDLDDHTLTPLEKIAQVVNKLGSLSRSRTPKRPSQMSRVLQWPTLTVTGNDALSMRMSA
jgi:hypothetical protein